MIYDSVQFDIKYQAVCWHTVIYQLLPLVVHLVVNQSNKSNKTYNAPCVASESEARISVCADWSIPYTGVNSLVFKRRLKVDSDSDDLQLNDKLFQTDGAVTLKAFVANDNFIKGWDNECSSDERSVRVGL